MCTILHTQAAAQSMNFHSGFGLMDASLGKITTGWCLSVPPSGDNFAEPCARTTWSLSDGAWVCPTLVPGGHSIISLFGPGSLPKLLPPQNGKTLRRTKMDQHEDKKWGRKWHMPWFDWLVFVLPVALFIGLG